MRTPRTRRGARRRYHAILRQCRRDLAGGLQFGMNWPTLRLTFPDRYAEIVTLRTLYPSLPE